MNITKLLNGIRIQVYKIFLFVFLLPSCGNKLEEPMFYKVIIQNSYFEEVYDINIDSYKIDTIGINEHSDTIILKRGNYAFSCSTKSKLMLKNNIKIQGHKPILHLVLKKEGILYFE